MRATLDFGGRAYTTLLQAKFSARDKPNAAALEYPEKCIACAVDDAALVQYAKQIVDLSDRRNAFDMLERLKAEVFDLFL
jgi:hypothetical protein